MPTNTRRTALITGASRGLGLALAQNLAQAGWSLMDHDAPTQPEEFDSDGDNLPAWLIVLTEREIAVVRMRSEGMTLHQCGLELGLSASRIGYMLKDIQVKVRKLM